MSRSSPRRSNRGRAYDQEVIFYASRILPLQERGIRGVVELAQALNGVEWGTPPGKPWTKSSLRRLLIRGYELGLMLPPRTLSEAARERPYVHRSRSARLNRAARLEQALGSYRGVDRS